MKNRHKNYGVTTAILLQDGRIALIDTEDIHKLGNHGWYSKQGRYTRYVRAHPNGKSDRIELYLHRVVMGCPDKLVVDHINHDGLDNRKCNLRVLTDSENCINRKLQINNTSGFRGVSWDKVRGKWVASLRVNYKTIKLGRTHCVKKAIELRRKGEAKYFPTMAPIPLSDGPEPLNIDRATELP